MKKIYLFFPFFVALVSLQILNAQIPDDTDGRLYRLCKTWGYFKYFSQQKCTLKWDTLLITTVEDVLAATSNTEFNEALMAMFNKVGNNTTPLITGPEPDTNLNFDNSWIDDPVFSQPVRDFLDTFTVHIYPDTSACLVKYNDYSFGGYFSFIDFRDDPLSSSLDLNLESHRLTYMFYHWNVINYFFPNRYLMDIPWDSTLVDFIPQFRADSTTTDFHITFLKYVTRINDSHGFTNSSVLTNNFWGGNYMPRLYLIRIDTNCVVAKVQDIPGVTPGDVLVELKGIPIGEIEDSLTEYIPASTPAALYRDMYGAMLRGTYNSSFSMSLLDSNDNPYTVTATRPIIYSSWYNWAQDPNLSSVWFITDCDYGYVNMGLLQPSQVPAMYNALKDAPAIIFDIRNYPNGTLWDLGPLLFPEPITSAIYHYPALAYLLPPYHYYMPGWFYIQNDHFNLGTWSNPNAYSGNVYILVNQETQSQAEYTCQYFSYHPNSRVFGTQTAGADGDVSYLTLPSGITTYFTSLGWYYSDYYQQQRNGVKIDTLVSPTREGLRHGKDEILLAALDCLTGLPGLKGSDYLVQVYPNPVTGQVLHISVELADRSAITVSLYSMTGDAISEKTFHGFTGKNQVSLEVPDVAAGLYLLKVHYGNKVSSFKLIID